MNAVAPGRSATVVVAGIAALGVSLLVAWLLGRDLSPLDFGPLPVDSEQFFDPLRIETAEDYRSRIRWISLGSLVSGLVALGLLAFWRGGPVARLSSRFDSRPVVGGAALGAMVALILAAVELPFTLVIWDTGRDFGILTSSSTRLLADLAISTAISISTLAVAGGLAVFMWNRFGRWFWIAASIAIGLFAVIWLWLWPVAMAPLFNDFDRLPPGSARTELERVAGSAGIEIEGVYTVDASRRTTAINAWVHGLGPSRRLVFQDTAIDRLDRAELSVLAAHELAHVESRDPERGLLYVLLSVPLAALAIQLFASQVVGRRAGPGGGAAVVLPLAFGVAVAAFLLAIPGAWLSRQVEIAADGRALDLTGDPVAMVSLQQRVAATNLTEPSRPEPFRTLFATHPDPVDRVGLALAWEDRRGAPGVEGEALGSDAR